MPADYWASAGARLAPVNGDERGGATTMHVRLGDSAVSGGNDSPAQATDQSDKALRA